MNINERIGLSSTFYAVRSIPIYDSVKKTADLGFTLIELGPTHAFEPDIFDTLKKIREDFPSITFFVHALFPPQVQKQWFNASDGLTARNKLVIDNLIFSTEALGGSMFSIHSPVVDNVYMTDSEVPGGFVRAVPDTLKDVRLAQKGFIEVMDYLDQKIRASGLKVAIENMDNVYFNPLLDSIDDFTRIFDRYPWAGLLLDIAHAKRSGRTKELASIGRNILEFHIHDNKNFSEVHTWGHFALKETALLDEIKDAIMNNTCPIILEHGDEVSEEELSSEKRLIEDYIRLPITGLKQPAGGLPMHLNFV